MCFGSCTWNTPVSWGYSIIPLHTTKIPHAKSDVVTEIRSTKKFLRSPVSFRKRVECKTRSDLDFVYLQTRPAQVETLHYLFPQTTCIKAAIFCCPHFESAARPDQREIFCCINATAKHERALLDIVIGCCDVSDRCAWQARWTVRTTIRRPG